MKLSITSQASKLSQIFDTALFGSTPLFVDNWVEFQKDKVLIADLSMNALIVYAEFFKNNFADYTVEDDLQFGISADLQKIYRKAFVPTEEINFTVDGLKFNMGSAKRNLTDNLKKASAPHVTPDKFPAKIDMVDPYGPLLQKVHNQLDTFNKLQLNADLLSTLTDTTASDYILVMKDKSFTINQEDTDNTWKLDSTLDFLKQEHTTDLTVRVSKNNFKAALSLHSGQVWLLCAPTLIVMTSQTPEYNIMTAVGTKKVQGHSPKPEVKA